MVVVTAALPMHIPITENHIPDLLALMPNGNIAARELVAQ